MKGGLSFDDVIEEIDPRTVHQNFYPTGNQSLLSFYEHFHVMFLPSMHCMSQDWLSKTGQYYHTMNRFEIKTLLFQTSNQKRFVWSQQFPNKIEMHHFLFKNPQRSFMTFEVHVNISTIYACVSYNQPKIAITCKIL